jgi:hypothetical protein
MGWRRRRPWILVGALALLAGAAGVRGVVAQADAVDIGARPGCDPSRIAVAHGPGGAVLEPQPAGAPVVCTTYTGFPGGESRIQVTNDGTVIFSPAPYNRGLLSLGYGPDDEPTASQWMFNNGGVAVSGNLGATWSLSLPMGGSWTMDDALSYYDRDSDRYFWIPLNSNPFPQTQEGAPTSVEQLPLAQSHVLFTDDNGEHWEIGSMCCPISDRAPFTAAPPPAGQAVPINGYPNVLYFCHTFGTGTGTCQKSLDGGLNWTFTGFSHRNGIPTHSECGNNNESIGRPGWDSLGPMPDGSLMHVLTCGGKAFLTRSSDEGATWPIVQELPHAGDLRTDDDGNLYLARQSDDGAQLLLSTSRDEGRTWSDEVGVAAPGVTRIHSNWYYSVRQPGEVAFTYNGSGDGQTTHDGYVTVTRAAFDDGLTPTLWSARVNNADRPLMYGDSLQGVGLLTNDTPPELYGVARVPPQVNQLGTDFAPDGAVWASFTEDCGDTPDAQRCQDQHGQTRGLAASLVWPS